MTWLSYCFLVTTMLHVRQSIAGAGLWNGTKTKGMNTFATFREEDMPEDYNRFELPPTLKQPPMVNISVLLLNMGDIDEKHQDVALEMNLRLYWEEPRLSHVAEKVGNDTFMVLNPDLIEKLWHPDVFIDRTIDVARPTILTTPSSVRIFRSGIMRYSARFTVSVSCEMDFRYYPGDSQKCGVHFMSYAYPTEILELAWGRRGASAARPFLLPNFDAKLDKISNHTTKSSSGVSYRTLVMTISLQRKLSRHVIQTYAPSTIVVILSWLSFLVPDENASDRIMGGMTLLLALIFLYSSVGQTMPKVSYFTALDIWMVTCIIFVFVTLIEYTVVLKLQTASKRLASNEVIGKGTLLKNAKVIDQNSSPLGPEQATKALEKADRLYIMAEALERLTFVILPFVYILFNFIYWPWLIFTAEPYITQKYAA